VAFIISALEAAKATGIERSRESRSREQGPEERGKLSDGNGKGPMERLSSAGQKQQIKPPTEA
jgi:hypothetical protein